jgi:mannose-6-phosphate isomerase-like protein (cupin superfamily)
LKAWYNMKFAHRIYQPKIVDKAWGSEVWIENNSEYCGKLLKFRAGEKFSLHFHSKKKESWYCLKGPFKLTLLDTVNAKEESYIFDEGSAITIDRLLPHQLEYIGDDEGVIFEVSTEHFDSDSYRIHR